MNPEKIHDALNFLDDDLIEETDDLRQGRRVLYKRPTVRQVIRWAAPAACLVLLLGTAFRFAPAVTENYAQLDGELQNMEAASPGDAVQDSITHSESPADVTDGWQKVSNGGISLSLPGDWEHELTIADDGSYFIVIRPAGGEGSIQVGYMPNFGVCGTGLTEKETNIAGMKALAGYYDGGTRWTFITFPGPDYVILNDGAYDWWETQEETIGMILGTIVFES